MTKSEKKEQEKVLPEDKDECKKNEQNEKKSTPIKDETLEEKFKTTQEKLLRSMAEMENQRRRFEKEKKATPIKEETLEEKFKTTQEKLLRTMAEMENQRRRFEKEKQEAFEFGGFNFAAESLLLLDNIDRAIVSFKNDESLKNNKDLNKIIHGIEIVKKDLVSIFKKKWN